MATYMHHLATTESLCLVQLPICLAANMSSFNYVSEFLAFFQTGLKRLKYKHESF